MFALLRKNGRALLVTLCALAWAALPFAAFSQPRTQIPETELTASLENGFARLVLAFPEELKADVKLANNVLVIRFAKPMRVSVDRVQSQFKEFVQAVRADPDGNAIRIAFSQKITVNTMEAGEKLFVDLLPESWTGLPPGLPQDVVDDLAKRAREAERKARIEHVAPRVWQPVKLRFAEAPGFSRFAFTISEPMPITASQDGQELKITFNAPVKIDFGDVRASLPSSVVSLDADYVEGVAVVRLVLAPEATFRQFREANAFIADVMPAPPAKPEQLQGEVPTPLPQMNAQADVSPQTRPADKPLQNETQPAAGVQQPVPPQPVAEAVKPKEEPAPVRQPLTGEVQASVELAPNGVRILFPFQEPVASAVFRRGDRIWMVFDTKRPINVSELIADRTRSFSDVAVTDTDNGKAVRMKLKGGWLTSAESDGQNWTVHFGDAVVGISRPLIVRRMTEENGTVLAVPLDGALNGKVHRVDDPDIGDDIRIVTALAPVRGVLRAQDFLEFKLLPSAHGIALHPLADDLNVLPKADHVLIGRPKGLALSIATRAPNARPDRAVSSPLDATLWEAERNRRFRERESEIMNATSEAPANQRQDSRMMLATFYLAHGLATEAKGALDSIVREDSKAPVNARFYLLRGLSEFMIGRPAKALESLTNTELAGSQDAALIRAAAYAELSGWTDVRENFRAGSAGLKLLPVDLQRQVLFAALRAAVEVRDFSEAGRLMNELDSTEIPEDMKTEFTVLAGRVSEGLGRADRAETFFAAAAKSDGPAAAEARYKQIELKLARGEINRPKAIDRLEALAFGWRGDRIELESNRLLARLYVEEARYRDAFRLLDAALLAQPNAPVTRTFQNEMAVVFEDLFLSGKADALPPIEALALYYDFSKLTPIGRRGDELIRRLSERLVAVDLLDQASELLEHQVQFRLTGAAKAQVASRLAIVHLMNRKPQKAIAILGATRLADLPKDMREQRLLLESRALMGANRFDNAIDVLASLKGPETERQRADVFWTAKRWRQAGEAIELMLGERWKEEETLNEIERHDVLRAGLAYALAGETLSLTRLKEKFGGKMDGAPEKAAFDQIAAKPNPRAIGAAAKLLANVDSLAVFLKMYQAKFPSAQMPAPSEQLTAR
jgi:tetratricopeptide (TPR) repeat protein